MIGSGWGLKELSQVAHIFGTTYQERFNGWVWERDEIGFGHGNLRGPKGH